MRTLTRQLLAIAIFTLCIGTHAAVFKTDGRTWAAALSEWQALYLLYFVAACVIVKLGLESRRRIR